MTSLDASIGETFGDRKRQWGYSRPPVIVVLATLVLITVVVLVAFPGVAPYDASYINPGDALQGPSSRHLLGTDQLGRDILSRVIFGARTAFLAPLALAGITILLGLVLGLLAGFAGGWVDSVISRIVDVLYSIPALMVAIIVVGVTGGGLVLALLVLIVFNLPTNVRLIRASVLERVRLPYIEAARTTGLSNAEILVNQLIPALVPLLVTTFFLQFTYGIVEVSSLSFLGLGVPPGSPDWGRMMFENRALLSSNMWATAAPGILLVLLAVSANVIGDWVFARHESEVRER
ncbi:peptide/nickel transport system permease protein [Antricoccus suffuscus]|uniref:Peptide/nickel transport system permease protein n=1 Tax=Antricoccus suffuscus TaxID=1629062 RepID=A0A2T0ZTN5_9ACTN|nr:ABC transporter permease [Antricoccus suffuscus]PRZ39683.1 peptide/nickel transport system permease protein [Antricoccus suffuscus]